MKQYLKLEILLVAIVLLLLLRIAVLKAGESHQQSKLEALGDSAAALALRAQGYEAAYAAVSKGFLAYDSTTRVLEERLKKAEARRYARAEIKIESKVDTVLVAEQTSEGIFIATVLTDPLSGKVGFNLPKQEFGIDLLCSPRIEQYIVQSASDELLIGVRALSPNTSVTVAAFNATPYLRKSKARGVRWFHVPLAALAGAVAWEIAR